MASNLELSAFAALRGYLISAGKIKEYDEVFKFGFNPAVGTTEETIWDHGGQYVYPASASAMTVSSSDANDTSAGTGAQTVQIYGLDPGYLEATETVILNGLTAVTTANIYIRMNRMVVRTAGSGGENAGVLYVGTGTVTSGVPANIYSTVAAAENQTLQTFWTVPANCTAYLINVFASSFGNANSVATIRLKARPLGEVFQTKDKFVLTRGVIPLPHFFPIPFAEKTDLEMTGIADTGTLDVSASMEFLIVHN